MHRITIANESITVKSTPEWAWTVLTEPFYFACWYGATPATTWEIGAAIRISAGPHMTQFDEVGHITQYIVGHCIGFKVYIPSILLPNTPENQVECVFTISPKKEKLDIALQVTANTEQATLHGKPAKTWKQLLRSLKKTIEDPYLLHQANAH